MRIYYPVTVFPCLLQLPKLVYEWNPNPRRDPGPSSKLTYHRHGKSMNITTSLDHSFGNPMDFQEMS